MSIWCFIEFFYVEIFLLEVPVCVLWSRPQIRILWIA